jgi:hypothetical protein
MEIRTVIACKPSRGNVVGIFIVKQFCPIGAGIVLVWYFFTSRGSITLFGYTLSGYLTLRTCCGKMVVAVKRRLEAVNCPLMLDDLGRPKARLKPMW